MAALATGLAVLGTQVLSAAPAVATSLPPGSVKTVVTQSPFDALSVKSFSANCPAGQRVLGGGALTVGGVHAVITEMQPIHPATGADSFKVTAAADQFGIAGVWSFQVFAFCATLPSSLQVEIVSHTNPPTSVGIDQAGLRCPQGVVVGGGGKIDNGGGQVDLGTGASHRTGIGALAKEDADGFAGNYILTVYAVCAVPNSFLDIEVVEGDGGSTEPSQKAVLACPTGFELTGLVGETIRPGTHLQKIKPMQANLADFGAQSSVPPTESWDMDYGVYCAR
jgi:hypothetical protein